MLFAGFYLLLLFLCFIFQYYKQFYPISVPSVLYNGNYNLHDIRSSVSSTQELEAEMSKEIHQLVSNDSSPFFLSSHYFKMYFP